MSLSISVKEVLRGSLWYELAWKSVQALAKGIRANCGLTKLTIKGNDIGAHGNQAQSLGRMQVVIKTRVGSDLCSSSTATLVFMA